MIKPWIIIIISSTLLFTLNIYSKTADIIISAEKKIYHHKDKYWDLIGKPKIQNGNDIIKSNTLKYFSKKRTIIAKGKVNIFDYANAIELFGTKGEYLVDNGYAKLMDNTRVFIIKDNIEITSRFTERINTKKYVLRGSVRIHLGSKKILAKADKGTYEVDIKKMTLEGNPSILKEGNTYSGDKIIIYTAKEEVILDGNAMIKEDRRDIEAKLIHYYSKEENKAVLTGNPKIVEYSSKNSLLKGKPYRFIKAEEITYYNTEEQKAILNGNPVIDEYFVKKDNTNKNNISRFSVYKRTAKADSIKYTGNRGREENNYSLLGNAQIYEPYKAAFADKIYYKDRYNEKVAILKGHPIFYVLNKSSETIANRVKMKGSADTIKYFPDNNILILKERAKITDSNNKTIHSDYINYNTKTKKGYAKRNVSFRKGEEYGNANYARFINENKVILQGKASFKGKDFEAQADYIEYDDDKQIAYLNKNAIIMDNENKASGESIFYKRENNTKILEIKEKAILTGKDIEAKGENIFYKKEGEKELLNLYKNSSLKRRNQLVLAREIIYYTIPLGGNERDEKVLLKRNVKFIDDDKEINGDSGEFYKFANNSEYKEKGVVRGNCHIINKDNHNQAFSDKIEYFKDINDEENIILEGNAETNDETKTAYGDRILYLPNFKDGGDRYIITGSPYVQMENSVVIGDKIELINNESNLINIKGNAKYIDQKEQIELFADLIEYEENNKITKTYGNSLFKDKKEELTFFAESITRYEKEKIASSLDSIKVIQDKKNIYGNEGTYYEDEKKLIVSGDAYLVEGKNYGAGDKIILNTKKKEVSILGRREGQVKIKK